MGGEPDSKHAAGADPRSRINAYSPNVLEEVFSEDEMRRPTP
jgi:hypothetical protein